ncbi:MAG: TrmB family transcriptional regulator [Candidatus Altiarchaeota archaeon]|nr:TrmB family transcriptional regulator [Candidatus Altiarchaeota archaeon]
MIDERLVDTIKEHFDLNSYEAKVWVALLGRGITSAGELAELTGVPRSRTYDILESLERKGLVIMRLGKPIKYISINPTEVIDKLKKRVDLELHDRIKRIDEVKENPIWLEVMSLFEKGVKKIDPTQISGAIRGRHHLHDRFEELFAESKEEILLATSGIEMNRVIEYHYPAMRSAKERGVKILIAVSKEGITDKNLKLSKELGEVRELGGFDTRFVITDEKEIIFMLTSDQDVHPSYDTGVWLHSPFFCQGIRAMFVHSWVKMKEL